MPNTDLYVHRLDGFDGSHWQPDAGPVDFAVLRSAVWWFAWKATEGKGYVDPTFRNARAQTAPLGFRHRLYYHWIKPNNDPVVEADHYLRTIGPLAAGEGVMLDAEEAGITEDLCVRWLERVEATTKRPSSVYTGLYVAGGAIWKSDRIRNSQYGPRPMHLAAYTTRAGLLGHLTRTGNLDREIHAWQWSSNGPVPGITGRADMNTIIDPDIYDRCCGVVALPVPEPIPTPTPDDDDMKIITNNEPRNGQEPKVEKYGLMPNGKLRHLSLVEWQIYGSQDGIPLDNWVLDSVLGWYTDPAQAVCPPCPDCNCPECPDVHVPPTPTTIHLTGTLS